jgi:endonuclease YncB( thermonuclease family)
MRGDVDVGAQMVRDGHAWSHRYRRDLGPYRDEEAEARTGRRGLFADPGAVSPREFRRVHGQCPR